MADFRASNDDPWAWGSFGLPLVSASNRLGDVIDKTLPTLTAITPMTGTKLAPTTPVQFKVSKANGGLASLMVEVSYDGSNTRELVWDSAHGFTGFYLGTANTATLTTVGGVTTDYLFQVLRDGGWPANVTITVFATDTFGNSLHP